MLNLRLGDVTISSIVEREGPWRTPENMFPAGDAAAARRELAAMDPRLHEPASGRMIIPYQSFLVRTPKRNVLIDTCTGEHKHYPPPMDFDPRPWRDNFLATGLTFSDIERVICTHIHIDHVGWNTQLVDGRWTPTFPRARYVFLRREYEYWRDAFARGEDPQGNLSRVWDMNCRPVAEAGQAELVDESYDLDGVFSYSLTPGHSPFHACVHIRAGGREAIVIGDLFHHPLQVRMPELTTRYCWDAAIAVETRRKFLRAVADTDTIILPIHCPAPVAGRIVSDGEGFRFVFV